MAAITSVSGAAYTSVWLLTLYLGWMSLSGLGELWS